MYPMECMGLVNKGRSDMNGGTGKRDGYNEVGDDGAIAWNQYAEASEIYAEAHKRYIEKC